MRCLLAKLSLSLFFLLPALRPAAQTNTVGLIRYHPGSFDGYTLLAPLVSDTTFLLDNCGRVVHSWAGDYNPGIIAYLLPDGNLLRTASEGQTANPHYTAGGAGDRIRLWDWDGNLLWGWKLSNADFRLHHDVEWMPNGNVLAIAWEGIPYQDCLAAGRDTAHLGPDSTVWSEIILELKPVFPDSAEVVWQWRAWDHLVQDHDPNAAHYGNVADHPGRIDLNYAGIQDPKSPDWLHFNGIDYNAELDQIAVSSRSWCEFWILDHGTTIAEAADSTGGRYGKGGEILYRWGNPEAYRAGTVNDRTLFAQHDAHWIEAGLNDAGKIMIFNNGTDRPGGDASSVDIITPPQDSAGWYTVPASGQAHGPATTDWTWMAPVPTSFYSRFISNAQRLPNGNTLINEGVFGHQIEIDLQDSVVWEYVCPIDDSGRVSQGNLPNPGPALTWNNRTFRVYRYAPDFPAFAGRTLVPGDVLEIDPNPAPCEIFTRSTEEAATTAAKVWPNPATDFFQVEPGPRTGTQLRIVDMWGRERLNTRLRGRRHRISTRDWPAGIYLVLLEDRVVTRVQVTR